MPLRDFMRRALLCCALFAVVAGACFFFVATAGPNRIPFQGAPGPATQRRHPGCRVGAATATLANDYRGNTHKPIPRACSAIPTARDIPSLGNNPYGRHHPRQSIHVRAGRGTRPPTRGPQLPWPGSPTGPNGPTEEWVNYFDQAYTAARNRVPRESTRTAVRPLPDFRRGSRSRRRQTREVSSVRRPSAPSLS